MSHIGEQQPETALGQQFAQAFLEPLKQGIIRPLGWTVTSGNI